MRIRKCQINSSEDLYHWDDGLQAPYQRKVASFLLDYKAS